MYIKFLEFESLNEVALSTNLIGANRPRQEHHQVAYKSSRHFGTNLSTKVKEFVKSLIPVNY